MITYFHDVDFITAPSFSRNLDCIPPIGAGVVFKSKFFRVEDVHLSLDRCEYHVLLKKIEND
jgi:hypothetical protein